MQSLQILPRPESRQLLLSYSAEAPAPEAIQIEDCFGKPVACPVLSHQRTRNGGANILLDAATLKPWSPSSPTLYTLKSGDNCSSFGFVGIRTQGHQILVNGQPFYARGYIRGIAAHDHPNLLGVDDREFYRKNIQQAKRYGFNLVRFHSTIPDPIFVEEADRLGLFVHMELGFGYTYDAQGNKTQILFDEAIWRQTLTLYRNHPSVFIFCLGNEMHRTSDFPEVARMIQLGRELAPGKLIMDNTGWGEYDREASDVYTQHVAYFFPFKKHGNIFEEDFCWEMDGSVHAPELRGNGLTTQYTSDHLQAQIRRALTPLRPTLAHECAHYIETPDYAELNKRFDEFAQRVGPEYLASRGIEKPSYLTRIPEILREKGLEDRLDDYCQASAHFKKTALKLYFENLRLSDRYCGYEMLQFADNFKYENRNGIVDMFDDDKFIEPSWMRRFNDDCVLLTRFQRENIKNDETFTIPLYLSQFSENRIINATLRVSLILGDNPEELLLNNARISVLPGLHKLIDITLTPRAEQPTAARLKAEILLNGRTVTNEWTFWVYPTALSKRSVTLRCQDDSLANALSTVVSTANADGKIVLTDRLDEAAITDLEQGATVIVCYHPDRQGALYNLPGARDRFKPCIWDRGHNLGGYIQAPTLTKALASGRYFDRNAYSLVEGAYKVNLDKVPFAVTEWVSGVDKPVRDRMDALIHQIKEIRPEHVLRNFSYLFSINVGRGTLHLCGFNFHSVDVDPAAASVLRTLVDEAESIRPKNTLAPASFREQLNAWCSQPKQVEGVMNRFWELDDRPVEDTLFWEQAQIDFRKMK